MRWRWLLVQTAKNVFNADKETEAAGAVFKEYTVVPYTSCLNMKDLSYVAITATEVAAVTQGI